ncbi:MAG: helix-turn-helix domain-containing protein, partial [Bacteroidota bacterium]
FEHYHWPGNLRELQNVIKRAVLLTEDDYIDVGNLPKQVTEITVDRPLPDDFSKETYEKDRIIRALKRTNFNKSKAAKLLQVTRKTLYNKINHYNLDL